MNNKKNTFYRKDEFLPKKLIKKINENIFNNNVYEYRTKNNFLKCIGIIYHAQVHDYDSLFQYVALGSNYWKTVFSQDYHEKVIAPLMNMNIIESKEFGYRNSNLVGIRYRINPELTSDDCEIISCIQKGKVLTAEECISLGGQEFLIETISDKNFHVSIDREKAITFVENNAEIICNDFLNPEYVGSLPDDLQIEIREILKKGSFNTFYSTVRFAKSHAEKYNKQFFFFKNKFYVGNVEDFLKQRIPALKYHYKREISKVGIFPLVSTRSEVNRRMQNYLVNFPSKILPFIKINNNTVHQLDLRTSQFLLFANLLNVYIIKGEAGLVGIFKHTKTKNYVKRLIKVLKDHDKLLPEIGVDINDDRSGQNSSSDIIKFIRDVITTDFYSVVQKELGLPSRGLAKHLLFKLLFKKTNRPDVLLNKLKVRYPTIMSIIADFKTPDENKIQNENALEDDNRDSNFSVFLQCVEAEIFIDSILKPLRDQAIPCFTRHDSIVVADGYQEHIEKFARDVFTRFGFKYNHKQEDMFWEVVDEDELEDSGYIDWLIDENEINTDFSIEDSYAENEEELTDNVEDMDDMDDLDEEQLETLERLKEIGLQEDYSELVNSELLEELSNLPNLTDAQRTILENEIINILDGMSSFQNETNELLRYLISRY
jgi:hypothetical protein